MADTKKFTMRLVKLVRKTKQGTTFNRYMLVSSSRHWYNISASQELQTQFAKCEGQIVEVEASRYFAKQDANGYTNEYIAIESIKLADPHSAEYKEFADAETERDLDTLDRIEK